MASKTVPGVTEVSIKATEVTEGIEVTEKKQEVSLGHRG